MPQNKSFGLLGLFACLKGLESSLWIGYFWSWLFDISIQPFPLNVAATWFPQNLSSWHILEKKTRLYIHRRLICLLQWESDWSKIGDWSHWKRLVENHGEAIGWKLKNWLKKDISWPSIAIIGLGISLCGQANRLSFASAVGWDWIAAAARSAVQVFKSQGHIFPGQENRAQCNMRGNPSDSACSSLRLVRLSLIREEGYVIHSKWGENACLIELRLRTDSTSW